MLDGRADTCWRMAGDGTGVELTFQLAGPTTMTRVGMINGYAKNAVVGGRNLNWYVGNRRVLSAQWVFDDGTTVDQPLGATKKMQTIDLGGPVTTSVVRLHLVAVSSPGTGRSARDYTAVSEVTLVGTPGLTDGDFRPAGGSRSPWRRPRCCCGSPASQHLGRPLGVGGADVEVRDQPHRPRPDRRDQHPLLPRGRDVRPCVRPVEHHDVRVDTHRVDAAGLRQQPGVGVVLGEPVDVVVEGVRRPGREDAHLPHPAPEPLAPDPRLGDGGFRPDEHRADRGAEPLGEAHGQHVDLGAVRRQRRARGHVRVPEPRAVQVHGHADRA